MVRRLGRLGLAFLIAAAASVLGLGAGLTMTRPGRALLARVVTDQSGRLVRGSIRIGRVEGTFISSLRLDSVVVRDTAGALVAVLPRLEVGYTLGSLLGGRVVLRPVRLVRPRLHVVKHREGRLNLEEVLRLGEGPPNRPSPLVVLRDVSIVDGIVTVRTPWSPPGHLATDAQRDSALRTQRLVPGRRIEEGGREGLVQVRTIEALQARFAELRLVTPDRLPIHAVVDSLAAILSDPLLEVRSARGELSTQNDTLRFTLADVRLPRTRAQGEGLLAWPRDTLLFDFEMRAPEAALADLRFVSPRFPDLAGRARVRARSLSGMETQYDVRDLHLADPASRVDGRLTALTHKIRGLGFRGLDLTFADLDFEAVRPYLDTLPFRGRLSGRVEADGYRDDLAVGLDATFFDDRIAGHPPNRIALAGGVRLGGPEGVVFRQAEVTAADLDLETVRLAAPAAILEGRVSGQGTLDGPWRNVTFRGRMEHRDGERLASIASGRFGLDIRDPIPAVDLDLAFAPLDFEGVRRSFPRLTARGQVWGPVRLVGTLDTLVVRADLQGEIGRYRADGVVSARPPHWGADSLWVAFEDLDLALLRGRGPSTRLPGEVVMRGAVDSGAVPEGSLRVALGRGFVRELPIDTAVAALAIADSVIRVDSARVGWPGGTASAHGTLGWVHPHLGTLEGVIEATALGGLDSLAGVLLPRVMVADSSPTRRRLEGMAAGRVTLTGALDAFELDAELTADSAAWNRFSVRNALAAVRWGRGAVARASLTSSLRLDSLQVGRRGFGDLTLETSGFTDSLTWKATGGAPLSEVTAAGDWRDEVLGVDALTLRLAGSRWTLLEPARLRLADPVELQSPLRLGTADGGGGLRASGTLPFRTEGELDLELFGLDVRDLYTVFQRDTALARGYLQADLRVSGTGAAPAIRGTVALTGGVFGDFRAPLIRGAVNYRDRRLDAAILLWRTGQPVMEVGAALPLELAWLEVRGPRQLPGPLAIRARADSLELAALEAFSPNVRQGRGVLQVDAAVSGTWDNPRLGGSVEVRDGSVAVPGLGVTYGPMNGRLTLAADSIVVDSLRIGGGGGFLDVTGGVRLERLTRPILNLSLQGRGFRVLDVRDFLALEADGQVRLTGPVVHPLMTGSATARNTVLYFRDLITKEIVDLENPLYADLVDQAALRRARLGAPFQSRFLDSLTIRDFRVRMADRVWLRSNETNLQMEGTVTVAKTRREYRLEGTLNAARGSYTLRLGPVTRTFDVERGVVRYFGTPNLDATLDVEARHVIKAGGGEAQDVVVIAKIGGTLLAPRLTFESTIRPPLSQSDIVSLLVLGRPINTQIATTEQNQRYQTAIAVLAGALTSELERSLVQDERSGLATIEIRPGLAYSGVALGTSLTRLSAGWQLGDRWFVSLNAGFCPNFQQVGYRNLGAGFEYRFQPSLILSATAEPVQICLSSPTTGTSLRYQLGSDLRWSRGN